MPIVARDIPDDRPPRKQSILDGADRLTSLLVGRAGYSSVAAAVAEHTVFLHPDTVAQTDGNALFPVIRYRTGRNERGKYDQAQGVFLDDNKVPTDAFLRASGHHRGRDVQFNHVWDGMSRDRNAYTALWNVCATPAFLAKTTDGHSFPQVRAALVYRSYELYGGMPANAEVPAKPWRYDELVWAESPPPVDDLERVLRCWLSRCPTSIAARAAREIGWLFSGWNPDPTLPVR